MKKKLIVALFASLALAVSAVPSVGMVSNPLTVSAEAAQSAQWIKSGSRWWYRHADGGYTRNGWEKIGGKWYHFDRAGWMQTGWLKDGAWYYLNSGGDMATGWKYVGGKWYYMNTSGAMTTGWQKVNGRWYFMDGSGAMKTGWVYTGGKWYYMNSSGAMVTGNCKIGNTWYSFDSNGAWIKLADGYYYVMLTDMYAPEYPWATHIEISGYNMTIYGRISKSNDGSFDVNQPFMDLQYTTFSFDSNATCYYIMDIPIYDTVSGFLHDTKEYADDGRAILLTLTVKNGKVIEAYLSP